MIIFSNPKQNYIFINLNDSNVPIAVDNIQFINVCN